MSWRVGCGDSRVAGAVLVLFYSKGQTLVSCSYVTLWGFECWGFLLLFLCPFHAMIVHNEELTIDYGLWLLKCVSLTQCLLGGDGLRLYRSWSFLYWKSAQEDQNTSDSGKSSMTKIFEQVPRSVKFYQSQEWRVGVCLLFQVQCVGNKGGPYCVAATDLIVLYGSWFSAAQ